MNLSDPFLLWLDQLLLCVWSVGLGSLPFGLLAVFFPCVIRFPELVVGVMLFQLPGVLVE